MSLYVHHDHRHTAVRVKTLANVTVKRHLTHVFSIVSGLSDVSRHISTVRQVAYVLFSLDNLAPLVSNSSNMSTFYSHIRHGRIH